MELNAVRARAIAAWEELYSVAEAAIGIARMPSVAALQRWLRDAQRWSTEELRAWQGERLCGVLAAHGVAEVRNADAAFGALRTLPPRDLMPVERWATTSTGPMRTTQLAVQIGSLLDWYHLRRGERWAFLGAPPFRGNGIRTTMAVERIARRDRSLAGYELDPLTSRRRLRAASSGRYGLWFGDASTLRAMADAAVGFGLPPAGPKLVVSTGEALAPSERTHLASVFGCVVLDQFTWRGVPLAISCRAGRYHVVDPFSIVEVLDGTKPCEDEASGELVVTRLDERGPAMLRVRTGDRAIAAGDACPCGRPGPTLRSIAGVRGGAVDTGRRVLSSRVLRGAMSVAPSIREWQLVRHPRHFELRILADGGLSRAGRELVTRGVARTLDATVPVRVSDAAPSRISNGELREAIDARTEISLRDVQRMAERSIDVCHQRTQQEALT